MASLRELIIKISANSQSFQSEIARASRMGENYYKTMQNGGRQAAAAARESQRAFAELNNQFVSIKAASAGIIGAMSATSLITMADNWGQVTSRMKMATESGDELAMVQRRLMEISDRTYKPIEEQAELFIRSSNAMKELGYSTAGTIDFIDSISSALTINAASADKGQSAIDALSTSMVQGKVSGDEWNTVMEVMPTVIGDIARAMGTTETAVKKLAADGQLSMQQFANAVIAARQRNAELAEDMPTTVGDAITKLSNHMKQYIGDANSAYGTTQALSGGIGTLADNIDTVVTAGAALAGIGFARYFGGMASGAYSATAGLISAAKSEVALAEAQLRGTQVAVSRARQAVYRAQQALVAARGTDAQAAAEKRLAATQAMVTRNVAARTAAQTALNNVTAVGSRLMSGALGLVGGIPGIVMLGATAWYAVYQNQEQARQSAIQYASTLDDIVAKSKEMNVVQLKGAIADSGSSIDALRARLNDLKDAQASAAAEMEEYKKLVNNNLINNLGGNSENWNQKAIASQREYEKASRDVSDATEQLNNAIANQSRLQDELNNKVSVSSAIYQKIQRELADTYKLAEGVAGAMAITVQFMNELNNKKLGSVTQQIENEAFTKYIKQQQESLELLRKEGIERAKLKAIQDATKSGALKVDAAGNISSGQDSQIEKIQANAVEEYNLQQAERDKNKKSSLQKTEDAYKRINEQLREQLALDGQSSELAKMKYRTSQGDLAAISEKHKAELLHNADLIDQAEIKKKLVEYENSLVNANANARAANDIDLAGFGEGQKARERMKEMLSIRREFEQKNADLIRQYQGGEIKEELYRRETELNKRYLDERLHDQEKHYMRIDAQRDNWMGGMRDGFADWADDATDYATQASQGMQTAMSSAVGSITEMLNGNMDSWKDWGVGVLKIIQNVLVNMAVANAASGIGNLLGIGASAAGAAASSGSMGVTGAMGMSTSWQSYVPHAKGGVYDSPSLSAYSGGVYSTPQLFAFAKGAGVFAEAGPEAIMPLTRSSNGSLGVRAIMPTTPDFSSQVGERSIQVINHINNGGVSTQSTSGYDQFGREIGQFVDQRFKVLLQKEMGQGRSLSTAMKGRRRA
ncbi:phage tail tape measure protein [Pectobacterium cacticida]|uniref:phage tail tape measure protein n=1 Tax=Pectobacterium cacticida TaxID=69221 RepID=UPI003985D02C